MEENIASSTSKEPVIAHTKRTVQQTQHYTKVILPPTFPERSFMEENSHNYAAKNANV